MSSNMDVNDLLYFGEDSLFHFNTGTITYQYNLFNCFSEEMGNMSWNNTAVNSLC